MNILALLSKRIFQALIAAGAPADCKPLVRQSSKLLFGNYLVNGVMMIAKKLGIAPQLLAKQMLSHLDLSNIASKTEIVGPGFVNIFLDSKFLASHLDLALKSDRLGISQQKPQIVVVDYSAPNVAKLMHVGHLRSTIIGDAVVRTLEFLGHRVIRANHVGDWGTQFGMLIAYLEKLLQENSAEVALADLEEFYRRSKKCYCENKLFAERARHYVVKLQNNDPYLLKMWRELVDKTMSQNLIIYNRLKVTLTSNDVMGESLYNPMLPSIVDDLKAKGLAVEIKGAVVVYLDEFRNKKGDPMGVIILKKDGGYLYATTDIACARYRYKILHADRILYYVDSRQHLHLIQTWSIVRKAGYVPDSVTLEHHAFGMVLNKDGKPFKTRDGGTVKLSDLLDEALKRAHCLVKKKNPNMSSEEREKLANIIGIGALKYADLSKNRCTDYIFEWSKMLSFEGNTAPYIQYAYVRILSVFRKANIDGRILIDAPIILDKNHEFLLAIRLLLFEEALVVVAHDGTPHVMCSYLYNLAVLFSSFYENLPIISAENRKVRNSRLKLVLLTAKTLQLGLDTLGIETVESM